MRKKSILVPCDGATNIKLSSYDFDTLEELSLDMTDTPAGKINGINYNHSLEEFAWFDAAIAKLPEENKNAAVISPVSRGASGGLIDGNNNIIDASNGKSTLAYTQPYSIETDKKFAELCENEEDFFVETGSISSMPGSLTLMKRLLFEEMERPKLLEKAERFAVYPILMSGYFLGGDYLQAANIAGNEHTYWTCHAGARDINKSPGTCSKVCGKIASFKRLVPHEVAVAYKPVGIIPYSKAKNLNLPEKVVVAAGGHDTSFSHIPILSSFYQYFPKMKGQACLHVEIGTWIMGALIGAFNPPTKNMFGKGVIIQGTVDGNPTLTTMYAGGSDFAYLKKQVEKRGLNFNCKKIEQTLNEVLKDSSCFVLPNINPDNRGHGPFPTFKGAIIDDNYFYSSGEKAFILSNLMSSIVTSFHIKLISADKNLPIVITGGGAQYGLFGKLLSALTGSKVYSIYNNGMPLVETASLGAAIVGKASCLGVHPYDIDLSQLGLEYKEAAPLEPNIIGMLTKYRLQYLDFIKKVI